MQLDQMRGKGLLRCSCHFACHWGGSGQVARKWWCKCIEQCAGPLRQFLERVDLEGNGVSRWFFSKWLKQMPGREKALRRNLAASDADPDQTESSEVSSGSDAGEKRGREKQASGLEQFISGDNPVIVVMSILGIFVAVQIALHPR